MEDVKQTLMTKLYRLYGGAAKQFLLTASSIIPVWSGMALASFIPLARELHVALHVIPVATQKGKGGSRKPYNRVNIGMRSAEGVDGGRQHLIVYANQKIRFSFKSNVPHLEVNDKEDVNTTRGMHLINPGPWNSMQLAGQAFVDYVDEHIRGEMPTITELMKKRKKKSLNLGNK